LPEGNPIYPEDQITDRPERFFAAEIIREKLIRSLGQEVPHAITVQIEQYKEQKGIIHIHAVIWVEREGQKIIVIGKQGEVMKKVGQRAREDLEKMLEKRVYLNLWVKVKKGWSDNERALQSLGYSE
jgi:GTP-binding protein Era